MKKAIVLAGCTLLLATAAWFAATAWVVAQEPLPQGQRQDQPTEVQLYSYAIGLDIGGNFHDNEAPLHLESLLAGLQDAIKGAKPRYDGKTCAIALQRLQQQMQEKAEARQRSIGMDNRKNGEAFLVENLQQEGVKATESGLQFKVLESGDGPRPKPTDVVSCHYRGTLIDGTEFDSSYSRNMPAEFPVNGVIDGWVEALQMMHVGDKWQLFIPADLAYGDRPPGPPIQPGCALMFEIELLGIVGQ